MFCKLQLTNPLCLKILIYPEFIPSLINLNRYIFPTIKKKVCCEINGFIENFRHFLYLHRLDV